MERRTLSILALAFVGALMLKAAYNNFSNSEEPEEPKETPENTGILGAHKAHQDRLRNLMKETGMADPTADR